MAHLSISHADLVSLVAASDLPDLTSLLGLMGVRETESGHTVALKIVEADGDLVTVASVEAGRRVTHNFRHARVLLETEWDCPPGLHAELSRAAEERLNPPAGVIESRAIERLAAEMRTCEMADWLTVATCLRRATLCMQRESERSREFVEQVSYRYDTSAQFSKPQREYLADLARRAIASRQA